MKRKTKTTVGILVILILPALLLFLPISPLSTVWWEPTDFSGSLSEYFDRCNPCVSRLKVNSEDPGKYYSKVKFEVDPDFTGAIGIKKDCISVTEHKEVGCDGIYPGAIRSELDCADFAGSWFCRSKGYEDYGHDSKWCVAPWDGSDDYAEIRCIKDIKKTSQWMELRIDNEVVWRGTPDSSPKYTDNLAPIINEKCRSNIEADDPENDCVIRLETASGEDVGRFEMGPRADKEIIVEYAKDSDGDSVFDFEDNCTNKPGPVSNDGCPVKPPKPEKPVWKGIIDSIINWFKNIGLFV